MLSVMEIGFPFAETKKSSFFFKYLKICVFFGNCPLT